MELELSSSFLLLSFPPYFLLLCYPILYTFVSSFGPSTSIHVTLSSSLPTFVSAHPFQKFYPTKKEAFFLRTFLSLVLKNFLIQKRREREFYGYNFQFYLRVCHVGQDGCFLRGFSQCTIFTFLHLS